MDSHPVQTRPTKTKQRVPTSTWALLGVLLVLIVVAILHPFAKKERKDPQEELYGHTEEAVDALANVLRRTPPEQRLPLLQKYSQDESPGLRYAAVDALGNEKGTEAADALERAFADSASVVRQRALEVLPDVDRERGLRLLLAALRDEDTWIRQAAAIQLSQRMGGRSQIVDRRAVPMLIKVLDDPDPVVSTMAMSVLRKLTGQPWRVKSSASEAQKRAIREQWRRWWAQAAAKWTAPPSLTDVAPVRPARVDPAPDFELTDIDGRPIRLADQRGKITLLNFWGTWCPPCQQEIPELVRLDKSYRAHKLDVIGIALSEPEGAKGLRCWCRAHGVSYRQALATDTVLEAYGHIHEVPISVLIDAQGRIRYRWEGERDFTTFRAAVEWLLAEMNPR